MIVYIILGAVGIIACLCIVFGGILLFKPTGYDSSATATVTSVRCQEGTGKCNITLRFEDKEGNEITRTALVKGSVEEGSTRGILYDSKNPANFYPGQPPVRTIGAGLFIGGILLGIGAGVGTYFVYRRSSPAPAANNYDYDMPSPVSSPSPSSPSPVPTAPSVPFTPAKNDFPSPQFTSMKPVNAADQMVFDATAAARRDT